MGALSLPDQSKNLCCDVDTRLLYEGVLESILCSAKNVVVKIGFIKVAPICHYLSKLKWLCRCKIHFKGRQSYWSFCKNSKQYHNFEWVCLLSDRFWGRPREEIFENLTWCENGRLCLEENLSMWFTTLDDIQDKKLLFFVQRRSRIQKLQEFALCSHWKSG